MINKSFLNKIASQLKLFQRERGNIIKLSRDILQASKEAIFATHRLDYKSAQQNIIKAETVIKDLKKNYDKSNRLQFEGSYLAAMEEYVEAKYFLAIMKNEKLDLLKSGNISPEGYINGLADITGELVRQAVLQSTTGNFKNLQNYRNLTDDLIGFMMNLYLSGQSRQKFDEAKRNLKRLEQILYEVKIRELENK
ncbi:MAG: hypothetical protein AUJ28_03740 [Parcubacteria group bacterium CG1_02_37_51]|uniref:Haloacid dehalogenase n=2 Tax=Candidatus Komeiliibacteriota TaxID=1817908 RepID=A0A2M8DS14_9BACT|nr:MAG: hypothetical protein AUJ28_03740 [Parcubacteria group bacterium CG1_02_37_51]PIY95039.1 MAG: hypothetical protein COY67_01545 [Candidatus Komeilibacteria bacterium CG_4_10_14_0_8_um_filter_37_78]PJC02177.1 MAG: hypothetical protein CO073_00845 [Candidatus Komeilibacteria bacterium CG_4_9_14_0_8_um_filter_36_9]